jgi:hypothetical protein
VTRGAGKFSCASHPGLQPGIEAKEHAIHRDVLTPRTNGHQGGTVDRRFSQLRLNVEKRHLRRLSQRANASAVIPLAGAAKGDPICRIRSNAFGRSLVPGESGYEHQSQNHVVDFHPFSGAADEVGAPQKLPRRTMVWRREREAVDLAASNGNCSRRSIVAS